jgi:dipeptidyl-peptidase-4
VPVDFQIAGGGRYVFFRQSRGGRDPVQALWRLDTHSRDVALVADPASLLEGEEQRFSQHELDLREHHREFALGVTSYSVDDASGRVAFAMSGRVWISDPSEPDCRELSVEGHAHDVKISPGGASVGYVVDGSLWVAEAHGAQRRQLVAPEAEDVAWGVAEYAAAGDMGRDEGFWWSPDGSSVLAARVDNSRVQKYYMAEQIDPTLPPRAFAYPTVGTANASVSLTLLDLAGGRVEVPLNWEDHEYFISATWTARGLYLLLQDRTQRKVRLVEVDAATGATTVVFEEESTHWILKIPGVPAFTSSGDLIWVANRDGSLRLVVAGKPVTEAGLEVREVVAIDGDTVLFRASFGEPTEVELWSWAPAEGVRQVTSYRGVATGTQRSGLRVVGWRTIDDWVLRTEVRRDDTVVFEIESRAEKPVVSTEPVITVVGEHALRTVLLLPRDHTESKGPLPVLLDPYGGPATQRVLASQQEYWVSQWFADQGFAVVVTDGHGTPGRGTTWERSIEGDTLSWPLQDQVDALHALAERHPVLDLGRVAMRGWSFGGFMSTAAVLRRPDVFHAAIAGASDSDARIYSTYFKERYLGDPATSPENYDRCSLISEAPNLRRPLMLIHGTADDNVVFGHTLRMSDALFHAGIYHTVMPMAATSHMIPDPSVTMNRLLVELEFLKRAFHLVDAPA